MLPLYRGPDREGVRSRRRPRPFPRRGLHPSQV